MSAPSNEQLNKITQQAELDLNTYEAKVGHDHRGQAGFDAGVDTRAEKKFPGAQVRYGDDLATEVSRGRNGDPDAVDKAAQEERLRRGPLATNEAARARQGGDILGQGQAASRNNVGAKPPGPGGSQFKGSDYYTPEDVPGSIDAQGLVPPGSVTQASRETEGYERQ